MKPYLPMGGSHEPHDLVPGEMLEVATANTPSAALDELARGLWRRKLLIAGGALLGCLAGLIVYKAQTPVYRAVTSVQLEGVNQDYFLRDVLPISPLLANASAQNYLENQVKILQSRTLAARVGQKLSDLMYAPARPSLSSRIMHAMGSSPARRVEGDELTTRVRESLSVRTSLQSQVIEIGYDDTNPDLAQAAANLAVDEFVALNREARWKQVEDTTLSLSRQTAELKAKLEKSTRELQRFARQAGLVFAGASRATLGQERMRQLEDAFAKGEADRATKQGRYEAAVASPMEELPDALVTGPLRQYQTELETARKELADSRALYTPSHYKVKRLEAQIVEFERAIAQERKAIVARLQTEYSAADKTERKLAQMHGAERSVIQAQAEKEAQYEVLNREVESTQKLYDSVLEKVKEAGVSSALGGASVRVIDRAVAPRSPRSPNLILDLSLGSAMGLLGGICLVVVTGRSRKYSRPGDMALPEIRELGAIPSAGGVSAMGLPRRLLNPMNGNSQIELATSRGDNSLFSQSFRWIVASILFSQPAPPEAKKGSKPSRGGRALVVGSAAPTEGKTTVMTNLGIACAETQRSVLLIDADLRRPKLHDIFKVCNDSGFSDLLQNGGLPKSMNLRSFTRPTSVPNLWVMPSGPGVDRVSGLLHSPALSDLLARCREEFDLVIIDSPPMMLYPDTRLLGRAADGVVLVVRADRTSRDEFLRTCYQVLMEDGTSILGTILNGFKVESARDHAYTNYYGRYGTSDKQGQVLR